MLDVRYEIIDNEQALADVIGRLKDEPCLSVDTETVGRESLRLFEKAEKIRLSRKFDYRTFPLRLLPVEDKPYYFLASWIEAVRYYYKTTYKGRNKNVREYITKLEAKEKRKEAHYKKTLKAAQDHKSGLNFWENYLGCLQIGTEEVVYLIRPHIVTPPMAAAISDLLNGCPMILFQHALFDWKQLKQHLGIELHCRNLFDTRIAEFILTNGRGLGCSLEAIAKRRLELDLDKDKSVRVSNWLGAWTEEQMKYAALDVACLFEIKDQQRLELAQSGLLPTFRLECALVPVVGRMEMAGIGLDMDYLRRRKARYEVYVEVLRRRLLQALEKALSERVAELQRQEMQTEARRTIDQMRQLDALNPNSNQQLLGVLAAAGLQLPNTNEKTLSKHEDHPIIKALLKYREANKLLTTYLEPFEQRAVKQLDGSYRLYANFNPIGPETGRFSSSDPNLQNAPRSPLFRRIFVPRPGYKFVVGDLAGIEMRIAAELSQEPKLLRAFEQDLDIHKVTAAGIFNKPYEEVDKDEKLIGKTTNFGILYGQTAFGLSKKLKLSEVAARGFITRFKLNYRRVAKWIEGVISQAHKDGFVRTLIGRIRYLPDLNESAVMERLIKDGTPANRARWEAQRKREHAERAAVNNYPQGIGADAMKFALIEIAKHLDFARHANAGAELVLTLHDEVVVEAQDAQFSLEEIVDAVKECLIWGVRQAGIVQVPIHVGSEPDFEPVVVDNWGDAK